MMGSMIIMRYCDNNSSPTVDLGVINDTQVVSVDGGVINDCCIILHGCLRSFFEGEFAEIFFPYSASDFEVYFTSAFAAIVSIQIITQSSAEGFS